MNSVRFSWWEFPQFFNHSHRVLRFFEDPEATIWDPLDDRSWDVSLYASYCQQKSIIDFQWPKWLNYCHANASQIAVDSLYIKPDKDQSGQLAFRPLGSWGRYFPIVCFSTLVRRHHYLLHLHGLASDLRWEQTLFIVWEEAKWQTESQINK